MLLEQAEREKYEAVWRDIPDYRDISPGEENVQRFFDVINPPAGSTLLDIGCGAGVAGLEFERRGLFVKYLDITDAGLLPDVPREHFLQAPLWSRWNLRWKQGFDYGFCVDVLEHLPPEYTMLAIDRILSACRTAWLQIALLPDSHGAVIGQTLHLTVKPFNWWLEGLKNAGTIIDARDLCGRALYIVSSK